LRGQDEARRAGSGAREHRPVSAPPWIDHRGTAHGSPFGARACPPCPCPTRLRRARRLPVGHRSGRAASSAAATECHPTRLKRSRSSPSPLRPSPACPSARHWTGTRLPRDAKSAPMAVDGQCFPPGSARSAAPSGIDCQLASIPDTPRGRLFQLRTGSEVSSVARRNEVSSLAHAPTCCGATSASRKASMIF